MRQFFAMLALLLPFVARAQPGPVPPNQIFKQPQTVTAPWTFAAPLTQTPATNPLTITGNVTPGAPPLLSTLGTMLNLVGEDHVNASLIISGFNKLSQIGGQRANGTFAAPTQVIAGNVLMRIGGWGYAAAGDGNPAQWVPGHTGSVNVQSSEAWVGNHNGTQISVWTTPNGMLTPIQGFAFTNAGSFVLGGAQTTPTSPGDSPANNVASVFGIDDQTGKGINSTGTYSQNGNPIILSVTTPAFGGDFLAAGACQSGTIGLSGAKTTMAVSISPAMPVQVDDAHGLAIYGYVPFANAVVVKVCAIIATTPNSVAYNVRVFN